MYKGNILLMVATKYFQYIDRDLEKAESFIIKPQKYFTVVIARLVLCDNSLIQKYSSSCSSSSSFEWTMFLKNENDCNSFSSFVKNLFQIFGPLKEIQYFVDFRETALRLKQFSKDFVGYL